MSYDIVTCPSKSRWILFTGHVLLDWPSAEDQAVLTKDGGYLGVKCTCQ